METMALQGDREQMVEWGKRMCMPEITLPVNRTMLLECNRVKMLPANPKVKRKKHGLPGINSLRRSSWKSTRRYFVLASDVIILSSVKRKSTLTRRKPKAMLINLLSDALKIEYHPNTASLCVHYIAGKENKETSIQLFLPAERYEEISKAVREAIIQRKKNVKPLGEKPELIAAEPPTLPGTKGERRSLPTASASSKDRQKTLELLKLKKLSPEETESMEDEAQTLSTFVKMEKWASEKEDKNATQCVEVLKEIFETERVYVRDLSTLVKEYIVPLQEAKSRLNSNDVALISSEDLQTIFNNTENILKVNKELLTSIAKGVRAVGNKEEVPTVWEIAGVYACEFVQIIPFLRMYSIYCHQYSSGLERLSHLRQTNKELDAFLLRKESRKKNQQFQIQSLLIKPVQRICKYPLLFRELLKHMNKELERIDSNHLGNHVGELQKTVKEVEALAATVNEKVSEAESQNQLLEIYAELGGANGHENLRELIQPSRRYRSTWLVKMKEAPFASNQRQNYRLYLFNDLLIFAKCNGGAGPLGRLNGKKTPTAKKKTVLKLKVTHYMPLTQCSVKSVHAVDQEGMSPIQVTRVFRQSTKGTTGTGGKLTTAIEKFEVWCPNKAEADSLKEEINDNIDKMIKAEETREVGTKKSASRAWASRNKNRRSAAWRGSGSNRSVGSESKRSGSDRQIQDYQSLDDIRSKYSFKPREIPQEPGKRIVIEINFPKGPLGLALEHLDESEGVFVACVAATSVAEKGGLAVGDRLVSIAGEILPTGTTWEVVVDIVKKMPRPLKMTFERTHKTVAVQRMRSRLRNS